jgi:hypothetical protein
MADSESTLKLYGTAMYGSFSVLVGDILRPLISEGALTSSPHNLLSLRKATMPGSLIQLRHIPIPTGSCAIVRRRVMISIIFMIHQSYDSTDHLSPSAMLSLNPLQPCNPRGIDNYRITNPTGTSILWRCCMSYSVTYPRVLSKESSGRTWSMA